MTEMKIRLDEGMVLTFDIPKLEMDYTEFLGFFCKVQTVIRSVQRTNDSVFTPNAMGTKKYTHRTWEEKCQISKEYEDIQSGASTMPTLQLADKYNIGIKTLYQLVKEVRDNKRGKKQ